MPNELNPSVSFDKINIWRVEQYAKQQALTFSAAVRALVHKGWDANMNDATAEGGFPPKARA
jgi:hypothetical protein